MTFNNLEIFIFLDYISVELLGVGALCQPKTLIATELFQNKPERIHIRTNVALKCYNIFYL